MEHFRSGSRDLEGTNITMFPKRSSRGSLQQGQKERFSMITFETNTESNQDARWYRRVQQRLEISLSRQICVGPFHLHIGATLKIKSVEIHNFRSIKRETLDCTQFNSFVGPNGSGKSTVLNALNVFFGEINSFSEEDFHNRDTSAPIVIKITFHHLSDDAAEEFSHYVRAGLLVVQSDVAA